MKALFERLVDELPPGTASLKSYAAPRGGGSVLELKPMNPAAADFGVYLDDFDVYSFSFGQRSYWDFPYQRRYRNDEKGVLTDIEEMSRAVIAGNCAKGLSCLGGSG